MAQEQQPSLVGQEISGCEILQKVAAGGMGAVYKARHKALDRTVCVKILSPALTNDKKAVELFLTEARAIAELEHPNIVQVYNVGKEKGYYFIVMSFIEGQTLSQIIKKHKIIPINTVLDLFEGVLLGLDAAHAKGIIHRDIKPSNILINAELQPKIVDFGIAKKMDKEKGSTKTTELAGTAYFIAPEQALGRDLDTRADLYSVGASLYYVLTGQFPYNGKNTIDIIQKHINDPVPNPATLRPELPAWLAGAVQKLMSKRPEDRFQTAKETYVYFQKMRAEDQLRISKEASINLGENSALKLVEEEKFQTDEIQRLRQAEKKLKKSTSTTKPSMLPSVDAAKVIPNATSPIEKRQQPEPNLKPDMLDAKDVKPVEVYNPAPSFAERKIRETARNTMRLVFNFAFKLPVFIVLSILVAYTCHHFGWICSVHVNPTESLLANLVAPFVASEYAHHQVLYTFLTAGLLVLVFMSAAIKEYAHSTMTLLFLAIVSYMAGLFTPQTPFLDTHAVTQFLFTPEYYLCYLIIALVWAISLCFTYNRSFSEGLLGSSLAVLVLALSYLAPHLSIAPASNIPSFKILFFVALFSTVVSVYYLANRQERTAVVLPLVFLLLSSGLMWTYTVSGAAYTIKHTSQALIANIHAKELNNRALNAQAEQELGFDSKRSFFAQLDKTTDISEMSKNTSYVFFNNQIQRIAPEVFTEQTSPLFVRLLHDYFNGGESRLNYGVWIRALTLPIDNFNRDAQDNNAYSFLMIFLMLMSIAFCAESLLFFEE